MASYLFDTSALLAHYLDAPGSEAVGAILKDDSAELLISSLSITEFARRVLALGAEPAMAREDALAYARMVSRVVPIDAAVAIRAFELGAGSSTRLPLADALIAASAALSGSILVHCDGHFNALGSSPPERISIATIP